MKGVCDVPNPQNLTSFDNSAEGKSRASEAGKIGGKKSGETRRRKKAMRENLEILLSLPIKSGKQVDIEGIKSFANLKNKNISVEQAMLLSQISKALKGDTQAITFLRDTSGQKPVEERKVETNSKEASLLAEIVGQLNDK
jgi:hypothetical protein